MARAMKDSGIEWIGEIPEGWECKKLKFCSQFVQQKYDDKSDINLSYIGLENVVSWNGKYIETDSQYDKEQSVLFQSGDILWGKLRPYLAKVYHAKSDGCCSGEFCVIRVGRQYSDRYFWNLLISSEFVSTVDRSTYGTKMPRANADFIKNVVVPVPPINEQSLIADFLDAECARIDAVIEQTRASIEEYKKLKQSVITQAVTKGIRPGRKMKDSGVEWIGEIPEEWEVLSFTKSLFSIVDYRGKTPEKQESGTLLVTARNIKDGKIDYSISKEYVKSDDYNEIMHRGKVEIGDVLFTTEAPLGSVANADRTDFALAQRIIKFQGFSELLDNYYLKYWILSDVFQQNLMTFSTGSTAKGIKASKLGQLKQILPPLDEQQEIVGYLDDKSRSFDTIVSNKDRLIKELESYKKSMIFEYVTGKKEVQHE